MAKEDSKNLSYEEQRQQEKAARKAMLTKNDALAKIIKPLRAAEYEASQPWYNFETSLASIAKDYGILDMFPDYQRGHVWSEEQQRHFIENVLRGVVPSSGMVLQFNCPNFNNYDYKGDLPRGFQCVDGLQRYTAVQRFLAGEVLPFGLHVDELAGSRYSMRGMTYCWRMAVHTFQSRAELLAHYLSINAGGTPHSAEELERVRGLLAATQHHKESNQ